MQRYYFLLHLARFLIPFVKCFTIFKYKMGTQASLHTHPVASVLLVCLTRAISLNQRKDAICLQEPIKEETSSLGPL